MLEGTLTRFSNPIEFFELFFTEDLLELIFDQAKLYNEWRNLNSSVRKVQNIEIEDIRKVIGIVLYIVKLPNRKMYWNRRSGNEIFSNAMSRNRFDEIMMKSSV